MDMQVQPKFQVRMFGGLELIGPDGIALSPPRRILRALIALLALAPPAGWPRDELTNLLWGERDTEQARASLRQALAELRRIMGSSSLSTDRDMAVFEPLAVSIDVVEFTKLAKAEELEKAAALYRGQLLEGVSLPGGAFADRLLVERTRYNDMAANVLNRLLAAQPANAAILTAQRLLQIDLFREDTHRTLMRLYVEQGDRSMALRQYQICRDSLQRELMVKPEAETERLFKEIQSGWKVVPEMSHPLEDEARTVELRTVATRKLSPLQMVAAGALVLMMLVGAGWWSLREATADQTPLVAVLPFDNLAGDKDSNRLARGLTDDIITDLGRASEFKVLARNTTADFEGNDPVEAGSALHAAFVVDGSIQRQGGRLRVNAQLFDASNGKNLWSQRWDQPDSDLFTIQSEISTQIANRLAGGSGLIQEAGRIAAHRKPPESLTAYELYLLGTEKLEQITREDVDESIRLLDRALEIDPGLARAWVELHHSHSVAANFGNDMESHYKLAIAAAERAIELDPSDPEAHAVYAMSFGYKNDLARAKVEFDKALRMAPNQFEIVAMYTSWASTFGEAERGAEMVEEAIRLNPSYPHWAARMFAFAYFMVGRYEEALLMMDRVDASNLGSWLYPYRAGALASVGRHVEAKNAVAAALKLFPELTIEGTANEPGYNDAERRRLVDTMRLAGFPPCAKPEALAKIEKPLRLPECK
jgi:TolB-like protein/DNA-binding SARP family transcriptional activator